MVSSAAHACSVVDFDDPNFKKRPYDKWIAYGQSKTANIYMANELNRRYQAEGIVSNSLMPGINFILNNYSIDSF
jgi:NAD(P)-dependent dehydrogenase (short-subunit alcohol dehydrogenase family)